MSIIELVDRVVAQAAPGEHIEAYATDGTSTSVAVYGGEVESLTQAGSAGVGIRVVKDGRTGFAWGSSLDPDVVAETLAEARDNRPFAEPDEFADLAEPDGVAAIDLDLYRDEVLSTSTDAKLALALELERRVLAADPRVRSVTRASYADGARAMALASTTGIRSSGRHTQASISVQALADDGDASVTAGGFDLGRAPGDLSIARAADDAVERLLVRIGSSKPSSANLTVVLEPRMTATVMSVISSMLSGESVAKGRSAFAGRVGEVVASPHVTMVDDPTNPESPGCEAHDDEGLACRRVPLIQDGVLGGFLHNSISARRMETVSTASAARSYRSRPGISARALALAPGEGDLDALIATVDDGVLVTSMTGLHSGVNPVSGDFSVGVEGIRIRNGERCEPIKEATIATTLQRLLLDVSAVGGDVEWQPGGTGSVTIVVPGISLSGS